MWINRMKREWLVRDVAQKGCVAFGNVVNVIVLDTLTLDLVTETV